MLRDSSISQLQAISITGPGCWMSMLDRFFSCKKKIMVFTFSKVYTYDIEKMTEDAGVLSKRIGTQG